jgi:hypothetical protein
MTYLLQRAAAAKGSHRASATVGVNELTKTSRVLARELETGLCVVSFTPGEGDGEGAGAEGAGAEKGWGQGVPFEAVAQYEVPERHGGVGGVWEGRREEGGGLTLVLTPEEAKVLLETRMVTPIVTRIQTRIVTRMPCHSPYAPGSSGAGGGAGGGRERQEDWTCPECQVMCFGSKAVCFQVRILKSQYTVGLCSEYTRFLLFENFSCSAAPCVLSCLLSCSVGVMQEVLTDGSVMREGVDCQRERER